MLNSRRSSVLGGYTPLEVMMGISPEDPLDIVLYSADEARRCEWVDLPLESELIQSCVESLQESLEIKHQRVLWAKEAKRKQN